MASVVIKNWDNKNWLSSNEYIKSFNKFLTKNIRLSPSSKILDIGCGRGKIVGNLNSKFKFKSKPIGIDIVNHKNKDKRIRFKKIDASSFFLTNKNKFDLILIKQTIHFFNKKQVILLLSYAKSKLNIGGKLLIFSLKTKNNLIPCFKKMKIKLKKSLQNDELLFKCIRIKLINSKESYFNFEVNITKKKYIEMVKNRYISCLLNMSVKDISAGINELNSSCKINIKFTDTLNCIVYKKN